MSDREKSGISEIGETIVYNVRESVGGFIDLAKLMKRAFFPSPNDSDRLGQFVETLLRGGGNPGSNLTHSTAAMLPASRSRAGDLEPVTSDDITRIEAAQAKRAQGIRGNEKIDPDGSESLLRGR